MRLATAVILLSGLRVAAASEARTDLRGVVQDAMGRPVAHASVLIYHAGVKHGYSVMCPSCYIDCGKRAITGADGGFALKNVDGDLRFELLAVKEGFQPVFAKDVDSLQPAKMVLPKRTEAAGTGHWVRGRVVDENGVALGDAVVKPVGMSMAAVPDAPNKGPVSLYFGLPGVEVLAVTDRNGDFQLNSKRAAIEMLLQVEARGFALKIARVRVEDARQTIAVTRGAVIRGRLMEHGQPAANAEMGLIPSDRGGFGSNLKITGDPYEEMRVGTQPDGSFVLADVPVGVGWYVYPKIKSVETRGAAAPVHCTTKRAGEVVNLGTIELKRGFHLSGRVLLPNNARVPEGMRMMLSSQLAFDSEVVPIASDGSFRFVALAPGDYEIDPAVRGFHTEQTRFLSIQNDREGYTLVLKPGR